MIFNSSGDCGSSIQTKKVCSPRPAPSSPGFTGGRFSSRGRNQVRAEGHRLEVQLGPADVVRSLLRRNSGSSSAVNGSLDFHGLRPSDVPLRSPPVWSRSCRGFQVPGQGFGVDHHRLPHAVGVAEQRFEGGLRGSSFALA